MSPFERTRLRALEIAYAVAAAATARLAGTARRIPASILERALRPIERIGKGAVFDCRMCGQCILHATGMTCPMTCPKNVRNGPCGGVRPDGACEVDASRRCAWVVAWERSRAMPRYGRGIRQLQPALDWSASGSASWTALLRRKDGGEAAP